MRMRNISMYQYIDRSIRSNSNRFYIVPTINRFVSIYRCNSTNVHYINKDQVEGNEAKATGVHS